jgi:hypothetical protein
MVVSMHMQDCDGIAVGDLEDFTERAAGDAGADASVVDVVFVCHGVPGLAKKQQARIFERRNAAG